MKRPPFLLAVFALVLALVAGACGDTAEPFAAKVNGRALSQSSLDDELDHMAANQKYLALLKQQGNTVLGKAAGTFNLPFATKVLNRQIYLELVHQEFVRRKLSLTAADQQLVVPDVQQEVGGQAIFNGFKKPYKDTLIRRNAEVTKVQLAVSGQTLDAATMQSFYDQNQNLFVETCSAHILFTVLGPNGQVDTATAEQQSPQLQAQAAAAKARLDGGADFAAVAKELSQDRSNRDQGGDLQCGGPGRFVPEFEQAQDALQPGQVSAPVKTQFGWHLIKVTKRGPKAFNEVTGEIRQRLIGQAQQGFGGFLSQELAKARISVNPRYGRFNKTGQSPGIVPPSPPTTPDVGGPSSESRTQQQNPTQLGG